MLGRLYQLQERSRPPGLPGGGCRRSGRHSIRADDLLNGREPFEPPANVTFTFDDAAQLAETETWLRTTFGITQEGPLYPLSAALQADPRIIRGRELMAVAAYEEAEIEFDTVREEVKDDPLATYQLAILFRDLNLYKLSITAAASLITDADVPTTEAPAFLPACATRPITPISCCRKARTTTWTRCWSSR